MKCYLFVDNFRGFTNTYIPIADVNFLVGENSSGKTSVLGLMRLISSPQFMYGQEFGDQYVHFGHFSDMVSVHAKDRSYFRVGFIWEEEDRKKNEILTTGWLVTYTQFEGMPFLERFTFSRGGPKVSLLFKGKGSASQFMTSSDPIPRDAKSMAEQVFPEWIKEHSEAADRSKFKRLPLSVDFGKVPIMLALSLALRASDKNKKGHESTFMSHQMSFPHELTWVAPIRTKPHRTYDELTLEFEPEGSHTPYLIRKLLRSGSAKVKQEFRDFLSAVGKASGLFETLQTKNFGRGSTSPFELDVVLDGKPLNLCTVGYGVSQSLPVLVEVSARPKGSWFAIQQPEVHLHPRAQAALGDVFFEMAVTERKCFLIETHSDFTIDRFRMNFKKSRQWKPACQVLFFERKAQHNVVTPLRISDTGELPSDQPESYRAFFVREEMRLLEL